MNSVRDKFAISGLFYVINEYKMRKYLNIKDKSIAKKSPDVIVVMMNPGASVPVNGIDNNTIESEAIPDRTQDQIMKVMLRCGLGYARILNLSDLREKKSSMFYKKINELDNHNIPHSIFFLAEKMILTVCM